MSLATADALPPCPSCNGMEFRRASLFDARFRREGSDGESPEIQAALAEAASEITQPGDYLLYEEGGQAKVVALERDWTRVGRSLAADVRLDDPTISRRHALIVRGPDGVRVLDDRSLNGVFVNGERVEWRQLADGDEIIVGRYRLHFLALTTGPASFAGPELEALG